MNFRYVIILSLAIVVTTFAVTAQPNASPAVISAVAPVYPPIARTANATGDATVEVAIDRDGKVTQVESKGIVNLTQQNNRLSVSDKVNPRSLQIVD